MLKSLGLWKSKSEEDAHSSSCSKAGSREGLMMLDRFDERLEERYEEKSSPSQTSSASSPSLVPASSKKHDDGVSSSSSESSIVSQIQDTSTISHQSKHSSSFSRESSVASTIRGSSLSQRMDSSETLKECTPLAYPRDTSMLLETAELFHSWEESPNDDSDEEKTSVPRAPGSISRYPLISREQKRLANFSSSSFQNTSSGSVPLPFNGWQSSCDTTAHERQLSDLSKLSHLQSLGEDTPNKFESRKTSIASHCVIPIGGPTSRQSSLVLHPQHRRQLSGGSRVSFHEVVHCGGGSAIGSHFSYFPGSHIDGRSPSALSAAELSDSIHITCQRCNMEAFKNIRKPDMEDIERVKMNLRKVPPLAKDG